MTMTSGEPRQDSAEYFILSEACISRSTAGSKNSKSTVVVTPAITTLPYSFLNMMLLKATTMNYAELQLANKSSFLLSHGGIVDRMNELTVK